MICKLCREEKQLVNSHIISEFFYDPVYDEKHRINEISTDKDVGNKRFRQKGLREHLLCVGCEQLLSRSEKYVSEAFDRVSENQISNSNSLIIENLDYDTFKHFQLSILWRTGVSSLEQFKEVNLGRHEEILRKMILEHNVGEVHEYGCSMCYLVTGTFQPGGKLIAMDGLINMPERIKLFGHNAYRIMFGGFVWRFIVSGHSKQFLHPEWFLSKAGRLVLPKIKPEETDYFKRLGREIKR